jgi:O-antigen/teichoic acid export membrane protein
VSLCTGVLVARALGPGGRGALAYVSTITNLAARFASLGVESAFTRMHRSHGHPLAVVVGTVTWLTLGLGALAAVILEVVLAVVPSFSAGVPLLLLRPYFWAMPALLLQLVAGYVFFGADRARAYSGLDLAWRVTTLGLTVVGAYALGGGPTVVGLLQLSASLAFALGAWWWLRVVAGGRLPFDAALVRDMATHAGRYYVYSVARYALCYGSTVIAAQSLGLAEAGLFAVAIMLIETLFLFATTINLSFYPEVAVAASPAVVTRRVALQTVAGTVVLGGALYAVAHVLVPWLYGRDFHAAVGLYLWLLPGAMLLAGEQVVASFFAAHTASWLPALAMMTGALCLPVAAWAMVPGAGVQGLAMAASAAQAVAAAVVLSGFALGHSAGSGPAVTDRLQ